MKLHSIITQESCRQKYYFSAAGRKYEVPCWADCWACGAFKVRARICTVIQYWKIKRLVNIDNYQVNLTVAFNENRESWKRLDCKLMKCKMNWRNWELKKSILEHTKLKLVRCHHCVKRYTLSLRNAWTAKKSSREWNSSLKRFNRQACFRKVLCTSLPDRRPKAMRKMIRWFPELARAGPTSKEPRMKLPSFRIDKPTGLLNRKQKLL